MTASLDRTHDHPTARPDGSRTALVLGGGGSAGNAWLIGVLAGLAEGGLDATRADLVIGTSAGSTAAAQLSGARPAELLADILAAPVPPPRGSGRAGPTGGSPALAGGGHLERTARVIAESSDPGDLRRRMGASALALPESSDGAVQARWRSTVAARLPATDWPRSRTLLTAVDADTGEPAVFDRDSGVDLVDAVAASCAGGFAYRIGDRAYIDGGYRANADNADLAGGSARVLVLSPFGGRSRFPREWGLHLEDQVERLRAHGSEVRAIYPDDAATAAFGGNMMDLRTRPPAALAGAAQGRSLAAEFRAFWC